ncbi:hypothetical protein [Moritella viscosa]|uniref:Uncharacterized protein n=1 Tax=Moritella viscosa TaxID=80854 RepID=A0ABY1HLK5_9GAMM|nr:hypothetical protein [Moritella viscosa]SGZ01094.1 Putative uncharacterized protein [Moritella viscosa]
MGQAQLVQTQHQDSAAQAIAQVRDMFNHNRVAVIYNKQGDEIKRVICFAAGMEERDMKFTFQKFNQIQRAAIHCVIKRLAPVINEMAGYSLTEFNK